jgi:protein-disulfide isomerase
VAHWAGNVSGSIPMRTALVMLCALILSAQSKPSANKPIAGPSAFDKSQMEAYVRHLFVWPPPIEITVDDPKPSPMIGFKQVTVHATQDQAHQDETFYVSANGRQILQASIYNITENPFHDNLSKINVEGRPSLGPQGTPVVIVEFSDFQCHFCKEEAKVYRENLKDFPKEVHFYFADFPLENVHPWARAAAIAGRCVYRQNADAFWKFHDWIFDNQEQITPENLRQKVIDWGSGTALDTAQLTSCMDTKATDAEVETTLKMGKALGIGSTPTSYINGRPMTGANPWPDLKRVINFEVGYQQTAHNAGENCGCDVRIPKSGVR